MALNINGRMKVKTLKEDFKKEFGLTLRVYDGRSFADDDATLASIRKGDSKGGEFSPKRNMKVGNFEEKMMDLFGIKVQIAGSDDSYLCDNDLTLAGALEVDEKKMNKKSKQINSDLNNDTENSGKKKTIKLTVFNDDGGYFTAGIVTDPIVKDKLRERIEECDVSSWMDFGDGYDYFEASDYTDIVVAYGPDIRDSTIILEKEKKDGYFEEYFSENIDDTEIHTFTISYPDHYPDPSKYAHDDLVFFNQKYEKRIRYSVLLELDEEELQMDNIYIGAISMEELYTDDEIVDVLLYISKDKALEYAKEYNDNYKHEYGKEYYPDDELYDAIDDIIGLIFREDSPSGLKEKILKNHSLQVENTEGKGEWENNYVRVTDMDGEVLFEEGEY